MLDRAKVSHELQGLVHTLFTDTLYEYEVAHHVWEQIIHDPLFIHKARAAQVPWPIPLWTDALNTTTLASNAVMPYGVCAVDGSQIYPDRHYGISCFLINVGMVQLYYGVPGKSVVFDSIPYVFNGVTDGLELSTDMVNCRRQELELQGGCRLIDGMQSDMLHILLYDGSLIFWHLEGQDVALKEFFLPRYIALLHKLYEHDVCVAGYISFPKSKELVNMVRLALCNFDASNEHNDDVTHRLVDAGIAGFFLKPYERTIVFKSNVAPCAAYPDYMRPHFFYLHVGSEIGRVEIPAWVASNIEHVDTIARCIVDQCIKGRGYPVALAEAHEQAVIKGPDRDFFYHMLHKIGIDHNQRLFYSQKMIKKRGIGI